MVFFPFLKFLIAHSASLDWRDRRLVENCFASDRICSRYFGSTTLSYSRNVSWVASKAPGPPGLADVGALDATHETFREYERVVDAKYLDEIRAEAEQFSTKLLSRRSRIAECAVRSFKRGKNTIRSRTLRKLTRAIRDLQNKNLKA
jgi:hypothetical protein